MAQNLRWVFRGIQDLKYKAVVWVLLGSWILCIAEGKVREDGSNEALTPVSTWNIGIIAWVELGTRMNAGTSKICPLTFTRSKKEPLPEDVAPAEEEAAPLTLCRIL